ncbi:PREDICTED: epidermal retinol dehydrogenase 2-like [Priapulus caudatus]|uniref:Epidermal retinol dehydrogenase 2-like n=1 Tax=Priapulus caudatus TaxID=37621 RepID=A0ABM1F4H1_PRICU|nr:PREDICTED: epidermal retinol dehydrogenase 2-like [Priapulus caudatus]
MAYTVDILKELVVTLFFVSYYFIEFWFYTIFPGWKYKKDIRGETVLVTGAGSGVGRLLAIQFARHGAKVVCTDINEKGNNETVAELVTVASNPDKVHGYTCDVSSRKEVYNLAEKIRQDVGSVSILVNNAGVAGSCKYVTECQDDVMEKIMKVNALAHFWTVKAFLPGMLRRNHGHLVTVASSAGLTGGPKVADYCASKFAAIGFHQSVALEIRAMESDVVTTLLCPGHIRTSMFEGFKMRFSLVPSLEPEQAVDLMMNAILKNQEMLNIPKVLNLIIPFMTWFLPAKASLQLSKFLGVFECFDDVKPEVWSKGD